MFKHFTWTDRLKIEKMLKDGEPIKQIAKRLHFSLSAVYYEIKKGRYTHLNHDYTTEERYSPDLAEQKYREHLSAKGAELKIKKDHNLVQFIEDKICNEQYSPSAVIAEIREKGLMFDTTICVKTIYNYIDKGVFLKLTNKDLPMRGKHKRKYKKIRAAKCPHGESIELRPKEIDKRNTFGHWEMDCVVGKQKTKKTLLVLSERLTRQEILIPMKDHSATSVIRALDRLERSISTAFPQIFHSITVDNGSEFSCAVEIERSCIRKGKKRTQVFYCHPYCACERGTNENTNKLIRRFLPKGCDLSKYSNKYIRYVQDWINNYPRKILGWKTSQSLFDQHLAKLGISCS
jgi:IS30 family transposase